MLRKFLEKRDRGIWGVVNCLFYIDDFKWVNGLGGRDLRRFLYIFKERLVGVL